MVALGLGAGVAQEFVEVPRGRRLGAPGHLRLGLGLGLGLNLRFGLCRSGLYLCFCLCLTLEPALNLGFEVELGFGVGFGVGFNGVILERIGVRILLGLNIVGVVDPGACPDVQDGA
ncbi:hypothetical protein MYFR107205_11060 [Mycolicibacterium frederiksbergense]